MLIARHLLCLRHHYLSSWPSQVRGDLVSESGQRALSCGSLALSRQIQPLETKARLSAEPKVFSASKPSTRQSASSASLSSNAPINAAQLNPCLGLADGDFCGQKVADRKPLSGPGRGSARKRTQKISSGESVETGAAPPRTGFLAGRLGGQVKRNNVRT